jgi:hypothetical protein
LRPCSGIEINLVENTASAFVNMQDEEAALKEKIAKLESDAIDLLAATSRLTEVEEENRHLRLTVTNLVTILAECNKQEPKRVKLG